MRRIKVKPLMTTCEAAEYLTLSSKTLTLWRKNQTGPAYVKMGPRSIRYRLEDLDEFVSNKTTEKADT
jgi:excisionase family DNA binding protein